MELEAVLLRGRVQLCFSCLVWTSLCCLKVVHRLLSQVSSLPQTDYVQKGSPHKKLENPNSDG